MLQDLQRKQRNKKRIRQSLLLLMLCVVMGLSLVWVRGCSANMKPTYNDSYQPMDTHRVPSGSEN